MTSRSPRLGVAAGVILGLLAGGILAVRQGAAVVRDLAFVRAPR